MRPYERAPPAAGKTIFAGLTHLRPFAKGTVYAFLLAGRCAPDIVSVAALAAQFNKTGAGGADRHKAFAD